MNNCDCFASTGLAPKEALGECLMDQKQITASYNTFAGECTNMQLRDAFLDILRSEHNIQSELFGVLQSNGWYQTEPAQADKVTQMRQKFSVQF